MVPLRTHPSPFGLGWARPLAQLNAVEGESLRERFDRQLLIGMMAATAGFFAVSIVASAPFMGFGDLAFSSVFPLFELIVLVVFLARGGSVVAYTHLFAAGGYLAPLAGGLLYGGRAGWVNLAWALAYPVVATLLTGVRGGAIWTGITVLTFALVAAVEMAGVHPSIDPGPYLGSPIALAGGLASVSVFQMLAVTWFTQQRQIVEHLLEDEREGAEALLQNVLPAAVAERLRRGEVVADQVDEVTIVFADLVGFTTLAAGLPARRVVELLREVFGEIDRIAEQEGMEKVKTIGDCYMAVAGAPIPCEDHADRALRFACRVREAVSGLQRYGTSLEVRIGVHSGPAMAGILGDKRILYDLWGDTVNAASRLEAAGQPGRIQASETTLRLASEGWSAEDRGEIPLRGRAPMRAFFVAEARQSAGSSSISR